MIESFPLINSPSARLKSTSNKPQGTYTDHLANERTFLAWTRTSLGIFGFGCAVARFGGSNKMQTTSKHHYYETKPIMSGLLLIACGIMTLLYGIYRYYRINHQIMRRDLTEVAQIREPIVATLILLLSMIAMLLIFVIL